MTPIWRKGEPHRHRREVGFKLFPDERQADGRKPTNPDRGPSLVLPVFAAAAALALFFFMR